MPFEILIVRILYFLNFSIFQYTKHYMSLSKRAVLPLPVLCVAEYNNYIVFLPGMTLFARNNDTSQKQKVIDFIHFTNYKIQIQILL